MFFKGKLKNGKDGTANFFQTVIFFWLYNIVQYVLSYLLDVLFLRHILQSFMDVAIFHTVLCIDF
jgi:hypothetical protein